MIRALAYLQYHQFVNRTWSRLKRLRRPKYLLGAIVGGLYFYFYFFRILFLPQPPGVAGAGMPVVSPLASESLAALLLLTLVLVGWILPHRRAALVFTEAEIQFLFPAPITRRGLIHYKLVRSQIAILFTVLILSLVSGRFRWTGGGYGVHVAGWWVILSTLNLHFLGASFVRTRLLERGISNWQRRVIVIALIAIAGVAVAFWTRNTIPLPNLDQFIDLKSVVDYLEKVAETGPTPWLLLPFRIAVRPFLAADVMAFLAALGPALLLLALHYLWVIRSDVSFEEASLELSRKVASQVAAARAGNFAHRREGAKGRRAPFRLKPAGSPAVAFLWKNLISASQTFSPRLALIIATPVVIMLFTLRGSGDLLVIVGMMGLIFGVWSVLLGPHILRQDLRQDLEAMDVLKLYPLRGWQVVFGELLAPTLILTVGQWFLIVLVVMAFAHGPGRGNEAIPLVNRLAFGIGAAVLLPALNGVSLLIPNATALLFPAWFHIGKDAPHGIEATGQRLVYILGQMLVLLLSVIPAAIAFAAAFFPVSMLLGWQATVPIACATAAAALGAEIFVGVRLLGRAFEKFDVSAETSA